ncbi:MAG: DUF3536 domain-containing protein [Bacteroidetes bacterium]|nr:MAG: DUF3536 domain-containing protein [Bacteroidota bacterium]
MSSKHKYVCVHGHFYQPPRENAWLEVVEQQETARPFHDWNERIDFECYAPNAAARILDREEWIVKIRNNYNRISFNFGPTLLTWLEEQDPEAYDLILKADQRSKERYGGHGSAVAQVHSHIILPLANYRDKVTQVYWGVRDFEHRFGRYPEGIWLAETAVNTETLEILAAHGLQFTILAPRQAKAVRRVGSKEWTPVDTGSLDTRHPYWCQLPSGRRIALYFYHGGIAQEVAFNGLLNNGKLLAERLLSILDDGKTPQLAHIATDGESYGHHHRFGEMALAAALNHIEDHKLATLTNYGQFLELFPPEWEVQIHEDSSWSCVHGVDRWQDDCGCNTGGNPGWHQRWRKPLRETLDWLRDRLSPAFEKEAGRYLRDPWKARNDYIDVLLHRNDDSVRQFLEQHARRRLSPAEEITTLRLLEIQRHAILMYTSCGWFFDEISGIETNQILQYALRAMDYAQEVLGLQLHAEFTKRLSKAPSNKYNDGAASYLENVLPARVNLERVAMHFAVASLFEVEPAQLDLFNYTAAVEVFERIDAGTPRLAIGRLTIRSRRTHAEKTYGYAVLYLGQQHIIGNISGTMNRSTFDEMHQRTSAAFREADMGKVIGIQQEYFGPDKFTLSSLFSDEKIKIMRAITANSLQLAEANFRNVFNDNYQLMTGLLDAGLPLPDAWRNISAYVLNDDLLHFFNNGHATNVQTLRRVADDLRNWNVKLSDPEAVRHAAGRRIYQEILLLEQEASALPRVRWLCDVLELMQEMDLVPDIWRSQNVFYLITKGYRKELWDFINTDWKQVFERLAVLLKVRLKIG